jgi:Bcr/CflA subfamily drug resistance transporter
MKNVQKIVPSIILMIVLVGFPQISESIFTPTLPAISKNLHVTAQTAQLLMGSYFIAFAFGVLFWGWLSDQFGRRQSMLWGILVYLLGSVSLVVAPSFRVLLTARLVQAFGASVGSVVTQTIMRESFTGKDAGKVFAKVGAAMSLAPALGPLIGGIVQTYLGYRNVFSTLVMMAVLIMLYTWLRLPETRGSSRSELSVSAWRVMRRLLVDKNVWVFGILISGVNGVLFSYYAEAPFIFMNHFKFTAVAYGCSGLIIAGASVLGALISNVALNYWRNRAIMNVGLLIAMISSFGFLLGTWNDNVLLILVAIFGTFLGLNIVLPLALSQALISYGDVIGTASGMFSFAYYWLISGLTYGISLLHNGSIHVLPIYIVSLVFSMLIVFNLRAIRH